MAFPSHAALVGHLLSDILGDGSEAMTDWMDTVGVWLNAQAGGQGGQALMKNSNVDGDFVYADLALLSDDFPQPAGGQSPGVSIEASRSDHIHPSVGAAGGVGLVTQYTSASDGVTFSNVAPGLTVIDINPSPTLLSGHHYLWVFKGEWTDAVVGGETSMNFMDGSNSVLARVATNAANVRRSGTSFYSEDGTGTTVHRQLALLSASPNTGATRGATTPYKVLLLDLGNQ